MAEPLNPTDVHVGSQLRKLRVSLGVGVERLTKLLHVSPSQFQQFETGETRIGATRLLAVARFLRVNPIYFFEGSSQIPVLPDEIYNNSNLNGGPANFNARRMAKLYSIFAEPKRRETDAASRPRAGDGPPQGGI